MRPGTRCATHAVALCLAIVAGVALWAPVGARAAADATLTQGAGGGPFALVRPIDAGVRVTASGVGLAVGAVGVISQADPESAQSLAAGRGGAGRGDVLVADAADHLVAELAPDGTAVWSFDTGAGSDPVCARSLSGASVLAGSADDPLAGLVLVCDGRASVVYVVNTAGQVVWRYGQTGRPGAGVSGSRRAAHRACRTTRSRSATPATTG